MIKLLSISDDPWTIGRLDDLAANIRRYLNSAAGAQPPDIRCSSSAPMRRGGLSRSGMWAAWHRPFLHGGIRRAIEAVNPEYLVYVSFGSIPELTDIVGKQDEALKGAAW